MADIKLDGFNEEIEEEPIYVEMYDDKDNMLLFERENVFTVEGKQFAILVQRYLEEEDASEDAEENVVVALLDFDENGEEVYTDPSDEEFAKFMEYYEKMTAEWDEE
ncbi:MAG: DUF1292 domain-containing protein [Phascolarctobacterium sp.]|nr:DUF1292 domain-containing protein [Phascolarctobacterium sp.]